MSEPPFFEWRKSGGKIVRAAIDEFNGHRFINVREWAPGPDGLIPTKKGITLPLEAAKGVVTGFGSLLGPDGALAPPGAD